MQTSYKDISSSTTVVQIWRFFFDSPHGKKKRIFLVMGNKITIVV